MAFETRAADSSTPILHSQLVLPMRRAIAIRVEEYESFWVRVHRICDQYIQTKSEPASCSRS
jgi:hypothetical protein